MSQAPGEWIACRSDSGSAYQRVALLHDVLGFGERAEEPVDEVEQLPPLAGVGFGGHGCPTNQRGEVRGLTFRAVASSDLR